jgi:AcrR family transcriptional regulator
MEPVDDPDAAVSPGGWALRRVRIAREIERAAIELFAVHGPDAVTVEQVAESAGISVRTFFRYFPTRDDVMYALPRRRVDDLCARVVARPASEGVLDAFIAAVHEAQDDPADEELTRLWGRAMRHWAVAQEATQPAGQMVVAYGEVIAARMEVSPDDLGVEVMATAIASVMWLAFVRWLGADASRPLVEVVEEAFRVLGDLNRHGRSPTRRSSRGRLR